MMGIVMDRLTGFAVFLLTLLPLLTNCDGATQPKPIAQELKAPVVATASSPEKVTPVVIVNSPLGKSAVDSPAGAKATIVRRVAPETVLVPGGTFNNGVSNVTLTSFRMSTTEIPQGLYRSVTGYNPSTFNDFDNKPVENVTWYDAAEFCNKLSVLAGREKVYSITDRSPETGYPITSATVSFDMTKNGYRLPTEAEWQFAAAGGNLSAGYRYAGSNTVSEVAWTSENSSNQPHVVASLSPNELGLYDLSGNVWEWCQDWYDDYPTTDQTDPVGADSGSGRALRGGGWAGGCGVGAEVKCRGSYFPDYDGNNFGFRVVLRP